MSMGFMIAAASRRSDENRMDDREMRRRDSRGRYMEGNDHSTYMEYDAPEMRRRRDSRGRYMEEDSRMEYDGNQGNYSRMEGETEMRRRRDSRGRYMEGGTSSHYMPWPEPHIPPYLDEPEMRQDYNNQGDDRRMNEPTRMRDRNVVNIRDYQDKRRIGFGENRMHGEEGSKGRQKMEGGGSYRMSSGDEKLTREKAEKWVKSMHGDDPKSRGEMWTYDDAKMLAEERGLPTEGQDMIDFYVALNMVYNDYCKVAKEHGVDTEGYYADLAHAWLYDRDGKPPAEKLMAYKKYVVPHGEE